MRLSWRRRLSVYAGLGAIAVAVISVVGAGPASADQTISHTFPGVQCSAVVGGTTLTVSQDITVGFIVPDQVTAGQVFTITFPGGSATLPSSADSLTVGSYQNLSETLQINNATFNAGSIVIGNGGNATINGNPTPETASFPTANHFTSGNPGPFPPGTLTTPTITATATAPASGNVTMQAFQLTTTANLSAGGHSIPSAVTCAIPNTILATIPVVPAGGTTTTGVSTTVTTGTVGPTTTTSTSVPATTTSSVGGVTTTTSALPTTTTTVQQLQVGNSVTGTGTNVNNCQMVLTPPFALVPPGPSQLTISITSTATPAPHEGQLIKLTGTKVTVAVPASLLQTGFDAGVLTNGEVIPATLTMVVAASNATPATHSFSLSSSPKIVVIAGKVQPLTVVAALPDTTWQPTSPTANVIFTEKSAVVGASLKIGTSTFEDTQTCTTSNPNSFLAVGATGTVTTTTNTVAPLAVATTTTVAAAASTLPFTGSNIAIWMVLAAITLDAGIVLIMGTRKRVSGLVNRK